MGVDEAVQILMGIKGKYEIYHGVRVSEKTIRTAVEFSVQYIQDRFLPDKACSYVAFLKYTDKGKSVERALKTIITYGEEVLYDLAGMSMRVFKTEVRSLQEKVACCEAEPTLYHNKELRLKKK